MNQDSRKLSIWRVFVAVILLGITIYASYMGWNEWKDQKSVEVTKPWFAPYVDVTATPRFAFEQLASDKVKNIVMAFIVSDPKDLCVPTWGGVYTLDMASSELDLDRRIARYRQQNGNIVISFGGLLNDELADVCSDKDKLYYAYQSVINRYNLDTIDLDIEGDSLTNQDALNRRAKVLADLQKQRRADGIPLAIWITLPVSPQGLTPDGTNAVASMLSNGVDLAGVNVMTMDYGQSKDKSDSMQVSSEKALNETHRQLGILYKQAGVNLSSGTIWAKLGATPMIGQNDVRDEKFVLSDAKGLNEFGISNKLVRMSMWSINRDIECGENYVNLNVVSDSCSGVSQARLDFSKILMQGFDSEISQNAANETVPDGIDEASQVDNPQDSPYQIWTENGTYLQGTKVVWHRNVYQAKWWTKGDLPDNPVLQTWETPWQLLGPVLPGEKPLPKLILPFGTYPQWSGTEIYQAEDRVIFMDTPYEAKWWTQGDSPAAATSNPDSSPWVMLSQMQIEEIIKGL